MHPEEAIDLGLSVNEGAADKLKWMVRRLLESRCSLVTPVNVEENAYTRLLSRLKDVVQNLNEPFNDSQM